MRYLTKTSLLATGLAFALTGAAFAQGTATTAPAQGSRPAAQAPAAAKPGDAANGQVRGHQGNDRVRAVTPAAPSGGAAR
jgi:hypothetical protein